MRTYFFLILVPPTYLALRILIRGKGPVWRRVLAVPFLYLVSQVYTINSTFFSSLGGPDIPAWLLLLQIWLFMALIILFLCTVVLDAISLVRRLHIRLFSKRKAAAPPSVPDDTALASRRAFLKGGVQSAACLLGAPFFSLGASGFGLFKGTAIPELHPMELFLPQLPADLDGFKIAHLSDIHVGPLTSISWVRQVVADTNAAHPDLICLTGDLVDGRGNYRVACGGSRIEAAQEFAGFSAPCGVLACTGNHEYYSDYRGWMEFYQRVGIRVLHNEGVVITRGRARLVVIGLNDRAATIKLKQPLANPRAIVSKLPGRKDNALRILLDHRPTRSKRNATCGIDLQLSGHTHGGQCIGMDRIVARRNRGLVRGWYNINGMPLYISNGAGLWSGFPVRLGIPAEIALITLRRGKGKAPRWQDQEEHE